MGTASRTASMKIVPAGRKKCIWMEAGVVSFKLCDNNYDCSTCVYDHAMQTKVERQRVGAPEIVEPPGDRVSETWVQRMLRLPASQRKCRYMITGEVSRKICPNAYDCGTCSFDQMMQERIQTEPLPVGLREQVGGFELAEDMYYHEGHMWAKPEYGGRVRVGFDDLAQRLLGKTRQIELPEIGQLVRQGAVGFRARRNGHVTQALSPIDGIVVRHNAQLLGDPSLIHRSPYEQGWLLIVEPTQLRKNLKQLHYGEDAHKFLGEERERLFSMASGQNLAADGGVVVEDIFEAVGESEWRKLVKAFLRT
jgi:glycine cleavage system H lipoate-binding protein